MAQKLKLFLCFGSPNQTEIYSKVRESPENANTMRLPRKNRLVRDTQVDLPSTVIEVDERPRRRRALREAFETVEK
jgi:hypothetical protein